MANLYHHAGGIHLRRLDSSTIEDSDRVEVLAVLSAERRSDSILEQIEGRLSLEPSVSAARWRVESITELSPPSKDPM